MSTALSYWPYKTYNWGRWPNDLGTLNLLSDATTARALASVKTYQTLALGAPLQADEIADDVSNFANLDSRPDIDQNYSRLDRLLSGHRQRLLPGDHWR